MAGDARLGTNTPSKIRREDEAVVDRGLVETVSRDLVIPCELRFHEGVSTSTFLRFVSNGAGADVRSAE